MTLAEIQKQKTDLERHLKRVPVGSEEEKAFRDQLRALEMLESELAGESAPSDASVPRHLPALDAYFVNREQELAYLLRELQPGKVVTLCGPGGIGKSALAARGESVGQPGGGLPRPGAGGEGDRVPQASLSH